MHLVIKKKNNNEENPKKNTCDIFTTNFSLSLFLKYNFVSSSSIYIVHSSSERERIKAHGQRLYTHTTVVFLI